MLAAPQATTTTSPEKRSIWPSCSTTTSEISLSRVVRLELHDSGVRQQRDVRMLEGRPHAHHLGVRLGVHQAGEAVAGAAADAVAVGQVRLRQPDPVRRVERVVAGRLQVVRELLDPRLVRRAPGRGTAHSRPALSGPRRVRRGPRRAARRACSTARAPRTRSARPARCRRGAGARRSPPCGGGRARRRRAWSLRRRSSGSEAGTSCPSRRTRCPRRRSGCRRRRRVPTSSTAHAASQSPRSRRRIRLPEGARWRASVPPPAPVPMMMTSYESIVSAPSAARER